jgi:glycosyltransferase involved in cell wall biosynthesis
MMAENGVSKGSDAGSSVRPVLLVDRGVYDNYAVYLRRVLIGLADVGDAAAVVCPGDIESPLLDCPMVEKIEYPALRLGIFSATNRRILLLRLQRFKPTVIHAFWPGQVELAAFLSEALDVPFILTFHARPKRADRCRKAMYRAARLLAPSDVLLKHVTAALPGLEDRIQLAPIGCFVEDSCACFRQMDRPASLIAIHPLDEAPLFEPLLGAVRHLLLDGFDLMLVLMGSGRAEPAIRRQIRSLGLTPAVTIVPLMRPLRTVLAGADVFLHLKDRGLFNAQMLEAMGVGLAIAGAEDPTSGLLKDGQTAVLWDGKDEQSIYGCLKRMLSQRESTRQLALNAQAFLRQQCGVSNMVDCILDAYAAAKQTAGRRPPQAVG